MCRFGTCLPALLQGEWQTEIDRSLEAGHTPILDLGENSQPLGTLPVLAALRAFVAHRADVTAPILLAGGDPGLWLALFMQARSPELLRRSPDPTVVFAGADLVTYLASQTTIQPERLWEAAQTPNATPAAMAPLFALALPASAPMAWESLPFRLTAGASAQRSANRALVTTTETWTGWLAIAIALGLIFSALLT